jgi:alkylated DNA repair protein (DNA oxidative demethylase)
MDRMNLNGVAIWPGFLSPEAQAAVVAATREIVRAAPLFHPVTPRGQQMSVRMTSAGAVGWVSDRKGYRYQPRHPAGMDWPPIPDCVLQVWHAVAGTPVAPDTCLVNFYAPDARMGLHQDRDEACLDHPVVSISLGDAGLFRVGGPARRDPTRSVWLSSGDVAVLSGSSRLAHHGIDRIKPGSSTLLDQPGRLNLTLRVAR